MEESAKEDPNFDVSTINAIKVSLMGPLSGIGDTFFWGIIPYPGMCTGYWICKGRQPDRTFILLLVFNIPNVLTPSDHTGSWIQQRCTDLKRDGEDR